MDVDGVLNTGHIYYSENGKILKAFGPHDKDGIKIFKRLGLTVDFITADKTGFEITKARLNDWDMVENLHLVTEEERFDWAYNRFKLHETAYIADGIFDAKLLRSVAIGIAPKSARREARAAAMYVTESDAGSGAVLDAALLIERFMNDLPHDHTKLDIYGYPCS